MTPVEVAIVVALLVLAAAAVVSGVYIVHVYRLRNEEALFLTRLVQRDIRVAIASAVMLGYLALALAGYSLGRPWGVLVIGTAIGALMFGVVSDAWLWFRERRDASRAQAEVTPRPADVLEEPTADPVDAYPQPDSGPI